MAREGTYRAVVALVTALAVGSAGCGGDDGPSKAEFVEDANSVCQRHYAKISAAAAKLLAGGELPSPREFGRLAQGTIIPEYSAQIAELRKVDAPEEQANAYDAWLDDSQALKTKLQGNPALIQQPQELAAVNAQADRLGLSSNCHIGPG